MYVVSLNFVKFLFTVNVAKKKLLSQKTQYLLWETHPLLHTGSKFTTPRRVLTETQCSSTPYKARSHKRTTGVHIEWLNAWNLFSRGNRGHVVT